MKLEQNETILGFTSVNDFATTLFGFNNKFGVAVISVIGGLTSLITSYVYSDANAIYFMVALLGMDLLTAIYRAHKTKTFTSKRLPRVLVVLLSYCLMLAISWNAAKFVPLHLFDFLPGMLYTGFITVLVVSIAENLMFAGLLPKDLYLSIKEKLNFTKWFKNDK